MPSRMSWRDAGRGILKGIQDRLNQRPEPAPEPVAAPPAAPPRVPRLTAEERAAAFTAEVWSLTEGQLATLIQAWESIDPSARDGALDQARPSLSASDRKDLFTGVREQLRRWQAGESRVAGGPASEIPSTLRLRANRVLLDAAMATVAQDRMSKRTYEVLYAPFRAATTGEPMHLPQTAMAKKGRSRSGVESGTDGSEPEQVAEPHDEADEEAGAPEAEAEAGQAAAPKLAARRSHARNAPEPEHLDGSDGNAPEASRHPVASHSRRRPPAAHPPE